MQNKSLAHTEPASDTSHFESDTQKVVRKHLEDKDHVISDADIRNVRIGMTPSSNNERHIDGMSEEIQTVIQENDKEKPADDPITPWDTIEHE